jgi:glycosyltransferase involved in cell wall biosynthesis
MPVVLITNTTLAARGGSDLYVRDIALALLRRGWQPVACSTLLGDTAEELRRLTVPVIDDPRKLPSPPDIIHAHHHLDAMAAIAAWPGVPVIAFCHGWLPWEETPFHHPQIACYVAVDELCRERLIIEHGIAPDQVELLLNFVDLHRFQPRATAPPERPRRALVFSNYAYAGSPMMDAIQEGCARLGITVEMVGRNAGHQTASPETVLAEADLVFAKARSALEALAVGCGVVVCDYGGLAGLVRPDNYDRFRRLNFGFRLLATSRPRPTADDVVAEIELWDALNIADVSRRVRQECGMEQTMDRLIGLYEKALSQPIASDNAALRAGCTAMAGYLLSLGLSFKGFDQRYTALAEAHHQSDILAAAVASQTIASPSELAHLRATCASHEQGIAFLRAECAARDAQIALVKELESAQQAKLAQLEAKCVSQNQKIADLQRHLRRYGGARRFLPRWLAEWGL